MVLFMGTVTDGYFLEEAVNDEVKYSGALSRTSELERLALEEKYQLITVDVTQLLDGAESIADELSKLRDASRASFLIYAPGFSVRSDLITALREKNFNNFIFSPVLSQQKQEVEKVLNGIPTLIPAEPPVETERPPFSRKAKGPRHIAVCGSMRRIGTTTQAIQIIKYLQFKGYKACYIEMNHTRFVETLQNTYDIDGETDTGLGRVTYGGITMYYKPEKICEILKMDYDYFVYDFGAVNEESFTIAPYLEKERKILVCGAFPNEYQISTAAMERLYGAEHIHFIFSFCSPEDAQDIAENMGEKAVNTIFAEYAPDPFVLLGKGIKKFDALLCIDEKKTEVKKRKHFRFRRGRDKNEQI